MKPWHAGLPETTEFSLFPPSGQVDAWTKDKERTQALLRKILPDLSFSIADLSLGKNAEIIPILGEAGEGGRGIYAAPPSPKRRRQIEAALKRFELPTD